MCKYNEVYSKKYIMLSIISVVITSVFSIVMFGIDYFEHASEALVVFETGFLESLFIQYFSIIAYIIILVLINRELSIDNY